VVVLVQRQFLLLNDFPWETNGVSSLFDAPIPPGLRQLQQQQHLKHQQQQPQPLPQTRPRHYPEITFTNVGWFHPNPRIANNTQRCLAARKFMDAVMAHERYNASAWTTTATSSSYSLMDSTAPRPILAFLDFDACGLIHWPKFGGDPLLNHDTEHGRPGGNAFHELCDKIDQALKSPALRHNDSRLIVLSCSEWYPDGVVQMDCLSGRRNAAYTKLVVGHMSATIQSNSVHPFHDFGLPPWPVKHVHMSDQQLEDLNHCKERPIEVSFKGRPRHHFSQFSEYFEHVNDHRRHRFEFGFTHYEESPIKNYANGSVIAPSPVEKQTSELYYSWIMNSTFCPTPRGDNLYSVRFSEVISAGCIPIVYADGWVLPYNSEIVEDWGSMAVLIPQEKVNQTLELIENISKEDRCRMQKKVLEFYNRYVKDSHGRLKAILKMMDARLNNRLVKISHAPIGKIQAFK
jgi:hypothetical protein